MVQAFDGSVQTARGWSEVLAQHWSANKAAADERWQHRQESAPNGNSGSGSDEGEDVDWRHRRVHADWRNLQNGTDYEPEDWRHAHVHADWRNLIPPKDAGEAADNSTVGTTTASADGEPAGEEMTEEEAAASLAERREELRREIRHQRHKDLKSHRSGLTGHLHTHEH